jgi:phage tail-like protein
VIVGGGTSPQGRRADPLGAFTFWLEIESLTVGGFSELSGLQSEIETTPFREGGLNTHTHQLPGPARYPQNLVLKRGLTTDDTLWTWYESAASGKITRHNATIYLLKLTNEPALAWNVLDAYPVRWSGPDFRADSSALAFETIELVHRGIIKASAVRPTQRPY